MDRNENGLSNLLAKRMPSLNSLSSNLNNGTNNALMNAFGGFAAGLPLGLWDNQLISAMSQYMDVNNSLFNLKQESTDHSQHSSLKRSDDHHDDLENVRCNKDVLDLKVNSNKRFKNNNDGFVQQTNQIDQLNNLTNNKTSKDICFLDNGRSFPCIECHKTFATEVDLKMHLLRHVMQHPFSCSTCGKGFKYEHTLAFHEKQHGVDSTNNKLNLKNLNKKSLTNSNNHQQAQKCDLIDEKSFEKSLIGNNRKIKFPFSTANKQQQQSIQQQQLTHLLDEDDDNIPISLLANTKLNNSTTSSTNSKQTSQNSSLFSSSNSSSFDFGFTNPSLSNLGIHMKSEKVLIVMIEGVNPHNDQSYTLYKCNICGFTVGNLGPVTEHILTAHSNNKVFNCDKCGANFKWKNDLLLHDQIHRAMEHRANNKLMIPSLMQNNLNSLLVNQYLNASNEHNKLDSNNNDNLLLNSNHNKLNGSKSNHHLNGSDSLIGLNLTKSTTQRKDSESSQESLNNLTSSSSSAKTTKNGRSKESIKNDEFDELSKNIAVVKENLTNNELGEIEETAPGQFKCRYCDKTFDRVFSVHRHERVHTGFKPCICKVCGKGFSELRNLRHHLLRFHSDGSGRELLRRVRKDKSSMNSEENNEVKRQLKAMEMNILSLNSNSVQSNTGSDEDLTTANNSLNSTTSSAKDKQTNGDDDNNSNHSNQSLEHLNNNSANRGSSRRKSSVPYKVSTSKVNEASTSASQTTEQPQQIETEEEDNFSSIDRTPPSIKDEDSNASNNDEQINE